MENQSKTSGDASVGRDNTTHPDFTWQDLDNDLDNYVVADQWFYSRHHVKAAIPVLKPIIYTGFLLSVIIITSGIGEIIWDAYLSPEFDIFGVKITAWLVGVASIIVGILFMVFHARNILSNIYKLAALPDEQSSQTSKTFIEVNTRGGTYIGGNVTSDKFVGRDVAEKHD